MDWAATEGFPFPLGATWVEKDEAWNFALYAKNAEEVDRISSVGLCVASESEIADRLRGAGYQDPALVEKRVKEYVDNCQKVRDLEAQCND